MLPMHEWLSGGVSPCQGEGRGFESRLVLSMIQKRRYPLDISFFVCSSPAGFERFECLRSAPVVAVERLILALMKWLWILPGLRCPYSRCQFTGCGSCPSDRWQYGQWSSRQTHARYMESIQEFWQLNPLCQRKGWKWILPLLCQFQQAEERLKSSVHFLKDLLDHVGIQQPIVFGRL